jgi:hypothetical protein
MSHQIGTRNNISLNTNNALIQLRKFATTLLGHKRYGQSMCANTQDEQTRKQLNVVIVKCRYLLVKLGKCAQRETRKRAN